MPQPFTTEEFAALARVRVEEIEEYRARRLIDPDRDGALDETDVLRLRIVLHYLRIGYSLDDLEKEIRAGSPAILYSDLLFTTDDHSIAPEQVAAETGLELRDVNGFRRALGLSGPIPREDVKFFRAVKGLLDEGVPIKVLSDVARVYGDTMRRLAQTEVRMIRSFIGETGRSSVLKDQKQSERLAAVQQVVAPILEPLLLNIHRQHLMRASVLESLTELEAAERDSEADYLEATIVFVDLVSFTPLAQVHGDEAAADVLDDFDAVVRECLEQRKGTLVKQIGDAVMLAFSNPIEGVRFAVDLNQAALKMPAFPALRMGLHNGRVLYRVGDYVGHTVNVASRIATLAEPHEIVVTDAVADAARGVGFTVEHIGAQKLAGVDKTVEISRIVWMQEQPSGRDPVCGKVLAGNAAAHLVYGGRGYSFCSTDCVRSFIEDPDRYANAG